MAVTGRYSTEKEDSDFWSLDRCKRAYTDYLANKRLEIEEQKQSRCYRHGAQWTPGQVEVFNARKQPVVTFNRVGRKIDSIVGLMEKLKQDPKAFPRNPRQTDETGADLATAAVRYVVEADLRESLFPLCAEHGAVDGVAGVEMMLVKGDQGDKDIGFALVRTDSFFYDPRSYDHDFGDARYMGMGKWLDVDDAMALAPDPETAKAIKGGSGQGSDLTSLPDREKWFMNEGVADLKQIRVVDIWYKMGGQWKWCMFTGSTKIEEGEGYFSDEKGDSICKYIMFSSFVDQDGDRYGFVRTLRSSQDEINQRRSKGLHELVSRRIKAEEGAFADVEVARREAVRPDGVVIYNKGFEMEFDDQARIANIEGQLKFLEDAKNEIENFGPSPALIGQGLEYKSGRAINLLQQAGIAELGPFVIGIKNWKLRIYRAIWSAAQRYWTGERWIRVTDVEGLPQMIQLNGIGLDDMGIPRMVNAVGQLDVNFVLDEGPDEINMMGDAYDTLVALTAQGANIPPNVLLELAPLQGQLKRKLLAMVNKEDPVAEQAKQLAIAGEGAKVEETKSKTALNLARAQNEAQGGDLGQQEIMLDAQIKREGHQMKMAESQAKVQTAREMGQIKAQGEFAKLQSQQQMHAQDVQMNALKGQQALRQGEDKHQQAMRQQAAAKAATPGRQFGGPVRGPSYLVGEAGLPELYIPERRQFGGPVPGGEFVDATGQRISIGGGGGPQVRPQVVGAEGPEVFTPPAPGRIVPMTGMGRDRFLPELQNPRLRDKLIAYTIAEVGSQGPEARQAFLEMIMNQATARGKTIDQVLSSSFFPQITHQRGARALSTTQREMYEPVLSHVLAGSNIANYATGNASGTVGFNGGPQVFAAGGERFGIEGPDRGWWTRIGVEGPARDLAPGAPGAGAPREASRAGAVGYTGTGGGAVPRPPAPELAGLFSPGQAPEGGPSTQSGGTKAPALNFNLAVPPTDLPEAPGLAGLQSRFQPVEPGGWDLLNRFGVSGTDPRRPSVSAGFDVPLGQGTLGIDADFSRQGLAGLTGTYRRPF